MHDLDVEWNYFDSDAGADRNIFCSVNHPFVSVCHNIKLIVNTLEDQRSNFAFKVTFGWLDEFHILRTDDNIDRLILAEALIDTGHLDSKNLNQTILDHGSVDDVAVTNKISNESVFRFVVDVLRSSDLLNVSLVHDDNCVRHCQCFFLIMCNIYEGDAEFFFQTDQFVLHILAEF